MLGRLNQEIRKDLLGKYEFSLLCIENGVEGDNGAKQPLNLLVALLHTIQLFPCHSPRPWPPLVTAPWGRIFQQHWCLQTSVLLPWLSLLYPCCLWEQGRGMLPRHLLSAFLLSSCSCFTSEQTAPKLHVPSCLEVSGPIYPFVVTYF